jgi:spoIIIJ-associated protein
VHVADSVEESGKTVEAAVDAARVRLGGVSRDQIEVEVLQEPVASTFGVIGSPARVRVTLRDPGVGVVAAAPAPGASASAAKAAEPAVTAPAATVAASAASAPAEPVATAVAAAAAPGASAPDAGSGAPAAAVPAAPARPAAARPPSRPPLEVDPELAAQQSELAGDFVEGLLELLDLEADITTWADQAGGHVDVEGPDLSVLVGRDGETLSALEELARLAVVRSTGERARVSLDVDGFKQRQRESISKSASEVAERVRGSGQSEELPPMSAYERKVVHDVIAAIDGVYTESVGEEPNRRVSILPG